MAVMVAPLGLLVIILGDGVSLLLLGLVDHTFGTPGPGLRLPAVAIIRPVPTVIPAL